MSIQRIQGYYRIPGHQRLFPSVTTILKVIEQTGLETWKKNQTLDRYEEEVLGTPKEELHDRKVLASIRKKAEKAVQETSGTASDFGSRSHSMISALAVKQPVPPHQPDISHIQDSFAQWQARYQVEVLESEMLVYSLKYGYAGTLDALGWRSLPSGQRSRLLIDWKTSNSISPTFSLQLAAYARAVEEMTAQPITEAWVVRFDKKSPQFDVYQVSDLERSWKAFHGALTLWKYLQSTQHYQDPVETS